jgi:hypothetical protein
MQKLKTQIKVDMILIDKSKVTHIVVKDLIKTNLVWYDEVKEKTLFFGLITLSDGYYSGYYDRVPTNWFYEMIPTTTKESIDINGVLHYLPKIEIYTNDKKIDVKYFDHIENALTFCKIEFPNVNYNLNTNENEK